MCLACRPWPPVIGAARFATLLRSPADALVHALKYQGWRQLAPLMGARMAALDLPELPGSRTVVCHVPTTRRRRRRRGYDQARLLAGVLAAERGWPLATTLERTVETRTQVSLHPVERRANVERAFRVRSPGDAEVRGARVVLVDDVLTTGATVSAAAAALERAGASGVCVVAFARAVPDLPAAGPD